MMYNPLAPVSDTAVIYHEVFNERGFSRLTRSWERYRVALLKFRELALIDSNYDPANPPEINSSGRVSVYHPVQATIEELSIVHDPAYIQFVIEMDEKGEGMFDRNDTPAWRGIYRRAAMAVGATLLGADLIATDRVKHVFNPAGGLHHAQYDRASGFCLFNDIVMAVRRWQKQYGFERIAILDVDGHHGDGTQNLLYHEPILTVSLHMYDGRFFPRTGTLEERGSGKGEGYCLNLPFPRFTTDAEYLKGFDLALEAVERYRPQAIILQYGADGHYTDRMSGLKLSTRAYEYVAEQTHALAHRACNGRLLVVGGGGYEPEVVERCWAILLAQLAGQKTVSAAAYTALHDPLTDMPQPNPDSIAQSSQMLSLAKDVLDSMNLR
ncbi:MAG: acetoin utilization protein AcuC [Chloroflexi bacterium]|uniref:Acetoin utilization protein AcuC n=1 Tax=Candidatus Chlorohelix allophototropha TaxID=3003348 RepID=A0A8T7M355_9CHLR|nr:acetoin utilization protein AcuC [Chloroflexota bacterium]WJW67237.1 hypothetical protein OZ401_000496 [Chloroflexota bacterium L227-S17]